MSDQTRKTVRGPGRPPDPERDLPGPTQGGVIGRDPRREGFQQKTRRDVEGYYGGPAMLGNIERERLVRHGPERVEQNVDRDPTSPRRGEGER